MTRTQIDDQYDDSQYGKKSKENYARLVNAAIDNIIIESAIQRQIKEMIEAGNSNSKSKSSSAIVVDTTRRAEPALVREDIIKQLAQLALKFNANLTQALTQVSTNMVGTIQRAANNGIISQQASSKLQQRVQNLLAPAKHTISSNALAASINPPVPTPSAPSLDQMLGDDNDDDIHPELRTSILPRPTPSARASDPEQYDLAYRYLLSKQVAREVQTVAREEGVPIQKYSNLAYDMAQDLQSLKIFEFLAGLANNNRSHSHSGAYTAAPLNMDMLRLFAVCANSMRGAPKKVVDQDQEFKLYTKF